MPWLSVVMPTCNGKPFLSQALESILQNEHGALEVVIVDDGSIDDTVRIARSFSGRLRMHIVELPHGGNWVARANAGLAQCTGEYACLLHQDDCWHPQRVRMLHLAAARFPKSDRLMHAARFVAHDNRFLGHWRCPFDPVRQAVAPRVMLPRLLVQCFVACGATLFRLNAARELGLLDESLWYTADWDLWLKLAARTETVLLHEPLLDFRIHPGAQSMWRTADRGAMRQQLETVLERHLASFTSVSGRRVASTVERAARFSVEANVALAEAYFGRRGALARLALRFLLAGPGVWHRYLRDSRIAQRTLARIRAGAWRWRCAARQAPSNGGDGPGAMAPPARGHGTSRHES